MALSNIPVTLSQHLKTAMAAAIRAGIKRGNYNDVRLAEKLGVSRQSIGGWKSGRSFPDFENLIALMETFNMSMAEMFGDAYTQKPRVDTDKILAELVLRVRDLNPRPLTGDELSRALETELPDVSPLMKRAGDSTRRAPRHRAPRRRRSSQIDQQSAGGQ